MLSPTSKETRMNFPEPELAPALRRPAGTASRRAALSAVAAALLAPWGAQAASWPSRSLKVLVGFPAGTSTDLLARTLAEPLAAALGQSVVVENKAGAGGNIAADLLAKADDDHTWGVVTTGPLTTAKLLNASLPFDPERDFAPLTLIGTAPMVLVSPANNTAASPAAFIEQIRALGDKANFASVGIGSAAHLGMEMIKARTGIAAVHVPYAGAPQILTALVAGEVQIALMAPAAAMPQARAGRLKAWAVTSSVRSILVPELPSLAEAGVRDFAFESWNAACAPARMPADHRARLARELQAIIREPAMRARLTAQGWQVAGTSPEALSIRLREDRAAMARLIRERGIKLG
jgi:tripartite-type tricarboxylate transporter receptor subunit TctC